MPILLLASRFKVWNHDTDLIGVLDWEPSGNARDQTPGCVDIHELDIGDRE